MDTRRIVPVVAAAAAFAIAGLGAGCQNKDDSRADVDVDVPRPTSTADVYDNSRPAGDRMGRLPSESPSVRGTQGVGTGANSTTGTDTGVRDNTRLDINTGTSGGAVNSTGGR